LVCTEGLVIIGIWLQLTFSDQSSVSNTFFFFKKVFLNLNT